MSKSFNRLASVLKLEAQQGYQNKAVVGGLRQFISFWISQAREEAVDEADMAFIEQTAEALSDYAVLPGKMARAGIVQRVLEKLEQREQRVARLEPVGEPADRPLDTKPEKEISSPVSGETAVTEAVSDDEDWEQEEEDGEEDREEEEEGEIEEAPSRPRRTHPAAAPDAEGVGQNVIAVRGVGSHMAGLLANLGIETIEDLLFHFPRRYDDYTTMKPINRLKYGEQVTIIGTIWEVRARKSRRNTTVVQAIISDGSGRIQATWYNQPWLTQQLKSGHRVVVSGKVEQYLGRPVFNSPQWELLSMQALRTGQIVSVYPLTQGLSNYKLRKIMMSAVPYWARRLEDPLPDGMRSRLQLPDLATALNQIHLPESQEEMLAARRRLAFEELLLLQLGMFAQRRTWLEIPGQPLQSDGALRRRFIASLPFALTGAQERVIDEITRDMATGQPMNRLLQGDVGAGKTAVAAAAMVTAAAAGSQAALMAPTEILAEQHARGLSALLEPLGIGLVLLTGSLSAGEKAARKERIAAGQAHVVIGTHALIQDDVAFANLGLAVIDEQHRFGVDQRAALREKGPQAGGQTLTPHLLVMSATPIPRSLALSLYGDLDLSVLDEMPPGRQEIGTHWIRPRERERGYGFVRGQVEKGRQAYIICPLVEESDKIEAVAAVEEYERLSQKIFPDLRLGLVHGRLSGAEKEAVMRQFYAGELDILVATSVIEVGVDVPNATVMVIEGANRFGLAQLHQFRGRVGRGEHQSYCLLVADESTPDAEQRLSALEQTNDGFQLAEKDLELRGPGEFFGRRQSGLPELRLASLTDMQMLQAARDEAGRLFEEDPLLEKEEHRLLRERVRRFWEEAADIS